MNYYEVEFGNKLNDSIENEFICIRGKREPSIEEAQAFCKEDSDTLGLKVCDVKPISEEEARTFYDFRNEADWPIFE